MLLHETLDECRLAVVRLAEDEQVGHPMRLGMLEELIELREDLLGARVADPAAFVQLGDPLIACHGSSSTSNGLISARLIVWTAGSTIISSAETAFAPNGRRSRARRTRLVSLAARASRSRSRSYAAKIVVSSIWAVPLSCSLRRSSRSSQTLMGGWAMFR
jgi:hypothetical protein